ncbi:centrosome-associated protein ALMS1 isoform X14 [Oryctolagus cuniculus]|uniref:centrosome-associated protein ALMS1 isoform X14 n=1 Tax=Oryctolagus cuniculus TaxID=9986 RepID=UPI003879B422
MEPEDLPWPGELEEEEEEEAAAAAAAAEPEETANLDEIVVVEEVEEETRPELNSDFNYEYQRRESTDDDEEDDEAKAWLQAHPGGTLPPPPPPRYRYSEGERASLEVPLTCRVWQQSLYQGSSRTQISDTNAVSLETTTQWGSGDDQKTESWHCLPQETDSSQTLDTSQTRFNVRTEGIEVTDFSSLEESVLSQSENQVKESNRDRDLLCSPLLVIQDNFASPDLPLLTCMTQDQEFGADSLFHQSELEFAPLRGIPDKSEDTEWFSRPSEVSEALFQATSEVASDLVNSYLSISQHPLISTPAAGSQHSLLPPEQENKEESISSDTADEQKTSKESDNYDAASSYISWKTRKDMQQSETNLVDQVSTSASSEVSEETVAFKRSDSFDASCSHVQFWKQETLQQAETHPTNQDRVSFPHEITPPPPNRMSYSFLRCLLEGRRKGTPLTSDSRYLESVCLRAPAENGVKQNVDSLGGYEGKEDVQKEVSPCFKQKETKNNFLSSEVHPRPSEIPYIGKVIVPDNSVKVSEAYVLSRGHDLSKMEASGGLLQTVKSNLDETSEQLYFEEERNQKATSVFGEKNVDATENVAFEAVIASIESSKDESTVNEISKSLRDDSQEREPKSPCLSPFNYNDENSFFDELKHPCYQSTPGVFEPAASKPLLHKKDDDDSSLYWHPNLKSSPNSFQEILIKPLSVIPELKSPASLSEKSYNQSIGLGKTQSALFQYDMNNEMFLPIGKIKSVSALDLAEKVGSSNDIYSMKVSTSGSLVLQDLKQQTFEEVIESSHCSLGQDVDFSDTTEGLSAAVGSSSLANLVACDAESQGALPLTKDASLTTVGQETLLKADIGQSEIPQPTGVESSFSIHTIMQNDPYFVEGPQGKAASEIITVDDGTECCNPDENAVACSQRVAELQRETCEQHDVTGECTELAALENLLDDLCDSSQDCQPASQQPSEEESNYQEAVSHSNLGINQSFSSILPPFVPHEPTRESEYHSSNLRMLRVSPDTVPKTLRHLAADASKGGLAEITQSNLKSGITTTPGDSDIGSRLSSSPEDLPQLVVHSQEATAGEHADLLHRKALTDSQLTEEPLKVSAVPVLADQKTGIAAVPSSFYSQREKPGIFYQQALPDSHLTEESLKVSAVPTPTDQKTEKGIVQPSSYSYREKPFYQQTVPDSHLPEEALKVSAASGPADQKTSLPTVTSTSYSQREEPSVFYQQELPESHLTEEAPSVSAAARPADRKTGTPTVASTSYSHGEKPRIFYQQALPESHVPDRTLKFSAVPGPVDQKTGTTTVPSTTYSQRGKPGILHQQQLPDSHQIEEARKFSAALGSADQKTGTTTVPSTSYSQRGKPGIFYQQELPDSHQIEEARKFSAALGSADQKTGTTTVPSTTYSQRGKPGILHQELPDSHQIEEARKFSAAYGPADQKTIIPTIHSWSEKPVIFYPQALPDRHQTEETLKVSSVSGPADQKTGIPTISSASYSHKEKPSIFYQQTLPDSNKTEEALKGAVTPAPGDQKTGSPAELSSPYSHRKQPILFSQQTLPDSHLPEEGLKVSAVFGSAEQKAEIAAVSSSAYSHRDKSGIVYQQELSDSHLAKEALKVAVGTRVADQKPGIPTGSSGSYSQREKPSIFYQQVLPDSHPTEKPLKVSVVPGLVDQNTGIPTVPSGSYSQRQKPVIFYQQTLPDSNIPEEALRVSGVPGPADKTFGIPTVTSTSYSQREKPSIFYQQKLPETSLTEESLKLLAAPRQADQRTGISTASSALYSQREKPGVFYQQSLPGSHLPGESPKVPAAPGSADHKTGTVTVPSSSYSLGEKSIIFYQQPDGHVPEEALNVSASPVSVEQKTGIPTVISPSHSHKGESGIFYQQNVSGSHLLEEALKVSAAPGPADQKVRTSTVSSTSSSLGEKAIIFYEQALPDSHPPEEDLKGLVVSGPTEQKTEIPTLPSSSYSLGEKPIILHCQALPGSPLTKEALKIVAVPEPADQKSGTPLVSSTAYSLGEKPVIFYQQALSDSQLTKETLKVSAVPGPVDQKTGTPFYSHREKPVISYQQELPDSHPTEKALKVSIVPGPADPKTGKPVVISASYPHREKPSVSYQQELSDLTEAALKILGVSAPADHKTVVTSTPYSQGEQSIDSYQQQLPDLTEVALKSVGVPGPADQKIEIASPGSYTRKEKSSIVHQQELPGVTKEAVDVFDLPGLSDQKTGIPTGPSVSYTDRQKPKDFHEQALPDSQVTGETLKASAVPGLADQNRTSTVPSSSYQHKEKLKISPVNVLDDQKTELSTTAHSSYSHGEKPKVSTLIGPDDQKPPLLTSFRSSYSQRIKPSILFQQQLPDKDQSGDTVKISTVPEPAEVNAGIPIPLSSSHLHREKPRIVYPQELPNKHLTEDALKLSTVPGPADQKTVLPTTPPSSFSHREKPSIFYPKDLSDRHLTEDALKVSSGLGKVDQITGLPTVSPGTYSHAKSSMEDSREEEGVSESDDCGGSIDSLAAHVKNLLQCESSLNHAKEILRNAEEEECRVRARARAWNMKFNLAHECGYSISELNEDDRRKVEEIKAELFGHGRTTDLSKGFQSPRGIGCSPEAVCGHIIIESHEKGCFRTLTAEQPQLDSHPCVFRSAEPSEMIRGHRSASSCTARHISLSQSPDQSNPHFKVWNSLRLESPSPLRIPEDFKISKSLRMPFHEPTCMPPKEMNFHSLSQMLPSEPMKEFTTSITFSSHRHSKCVSDSSILKVGVTESSPCTGASMGVLNSQEENPPRDLIQKASAPSSFKKPSHLPNKTVTILAEGSRQSQKLPVNLEHSHQEEKLIERSDFKVSFSEPSTSASCSNYKEIQFSDNQTLISMDRPSSTVGIEKNVTIIPDLPSHIFLEQRELFEQSKTPHADHHVRKHHSPPSPDIPSSIFLEQRELFERCKSPYIDHPLRESHSLFPQGQECIASDLPSPIFLEQRQSKAPCIDDHMRKHHFPLSQGQDCVVEKDNQLKPISYISNINVEAKFTNVVSQLVPDHCTLATSASTPPSNRKALSCVRITLCPKTPSTLESGALDKRFHSLDPACKTRMNSEFDSDLQTLSSRSLEPTSKLLTCKPVAQNQECLDFLGPISPLDFQVIQSPLPDSSTITQKLKTMPSQNSQLVTSRQIQVNISDLEAYSSPEGTPVSADRFLEESKTPFSGKISSDAVTQITTESPEKTMFSSEIFINAKDDGHEIPEPRTQKVPKPPVRFASSSSVQQITPTSGTDAQPELLPYKPSGSSKMFYVPQLGKTPSFPDSKSDTTIESSHSVKYGTFHALLSDSGSNDAIAPDFPAQVLGTRDDELPDTVNIKHKEGIYSKRAKSKPSLSLEKIPFPKDNADSSVPLPITGDENLANKKQEEEIHSKKAVPKTAQPEESKPLQKEAAGSGGPTAPEHSAQVQDTKLGSLPDSKVIKQKEEIHMKGTIPKKAWLENKESLEIDIAESESHSEFENTTHSVFRSAKFYFHHPVHLASDQDFCHESVGRSVLVQHSWKDFFQHHSDKHREHTYLPPPFQSVDKTQTDYTRVKSLSINLNLGNKEVIHTTKSQARDYLKSSRQINDPKKEHKVTREVTTQHTSNLNELWNKYQERQKQQKPPGFIDGKELSLVERLDRLAKLLQNPITHSLHASESTQDDSRGERDVREWSGKHQPQKSKLQKKKRYKSLGDLKHRNISDLKKSKVLSHQAGRPSQIKIEQIKFDKYILRKQPGFNYISNTSSESRPSEESELLTDTTTNILSTTTSVDSDILTQTDREVTLRERSSSISTIDTARLIQAFGHERVCMSPRRIKLYSSTTNQQRRYLEKRCKHNKKALNVGHPQMTSEHTRRKRIQEENQMISSDSVSSSAGTFLSSNSTICNKQNVHMLNKGVQAGHLEIVNGTRKHTRDVGVTFPTPSSSEARLEEDSDVTSWSEEKIEEKMLFANYLGDKKLRKSKQNCCEGVSWFVPVEDVKFESKKENLPKICGPGVSWFEPITKIKPWREPLREQNWQGQRVADWGSLAGPSQDHGRDTPRPFVRATLQEALQLHRPDFISRSGERIKRLRLIVQERKLQNVLQSERHALFNAPAPLPERVFLAAQKTKPIGKKEMIQRSKRMYEQLPEVQKKREEEKRRLEYKTYRLRAQLYKKKVTNQLLGRKVPWD